MVKKRYCGGTQFHICKNRMRGKNVSQKKQKPAGKRDFFWSRVCPAPPHIRLCSAFQKIVCVGFKLRVKTDDFAWLMFSKSPSFSPDFVFCGVFFSTRRIVTMCLNGSVMSSPILLAPGMFILFGFLLLLMFSSNFLIYAKL